jgi:hypothetical protein
MLLFSLSQINVVEVLALGHRTSHMFVSAVLASPLCVVMCLYRPLCTCLRMRHATTHSSIPPTRATVDRWLTFWMCAFVTVLPLHALRLGAYGIPLRWELSLLLLAYYGHDDARGAQTAFDEYLVPAMRFAFPRALQAYVDHHHVPCDEDGEAPKDPPGGCEPRPPMADSAHSSSGSVHALRRSHPSPCSFPAHDLRPKGRYGDSDDSDASARSPAKPTQVQIDRESALGGSEPTTETC